MMLRMPSCRCQIDNLLSVKILLIELIDNESSRVGRIPACLVHLVMVGGAGLFADKLMLDPFQIDVLRNLLGR